VRLREHHVRNQCRAAVAAGGILSVWACACALGQNLGFLKDSPIGTLTDADVSMMRGAIAATLQGTDSGTYRTWQNPETGSSGKITMMSKFNTQDGRECRKLRVETHTRRGGDGASTVSMCRTGDGDWKADPHAQAAPSVP
jgi:surface antigen